jgi:hypothetical protein
MTHEQLRQALRELNGERDLEIAMVNLFGLQVSHPAGTLTVRSAMLIPDEEDHLVKVTDGKSVFIIDAERVAWVRIGLK